MERSIFYKWINEGKTMWKKGVSWYKNKRDSEKYSSIGANRIHNIIKGFSYNCRNLSNRESYTLGNVWELQYRFQCA